MRRFTGMLIVSAAVFVFALDTSNASACPMCKSANDTEDRRPMAYMYSILFMLAMPATIFTGFGIGFYRLSKKAQAMQDQDALDQIANVDPPEIVR